MKLFAHAMYFALTAFAVSGCRGQVGTETINENKRYSVPYMDVLVHCEANAIEGEDVVTSDPRELHAIEEVLAELNGKWRHIEEMPELVPECQLLVTWKSGRQWLLTMLECGVGSLDQPESGFILNAKPFKLAPNDQPSDHLPHPDSLNYYSFWAALDAEQVERMKDICGRAREED